MSVRKKALSSEELDALLLDSPQALASYNEARLAYQVGREIRRIRKEKNWSQTELAVIAKVDQGDLSRLEHGEGERGASLGLIERVAQALGHVVQVSFVASDSLARSAKTPVEG